MKLKVVQLLVTNEENYILGQGTVSPFSLAYLNNPLATPKLLTVDILYWCSNDACFEVATGVR